MSNIVAVGDSITVRKNSYIDLLGGKKFAQGAKASFSLMGKLKEAVATKPDYVIIFVGINNPMSTKGCRPGWEAGLIEDLSSMYTEVKAAGARVIGITLMPAMKTWRRHYKKCQANPKIYGCCKDMSQRHPRNIYKKILKVNNFIRNNAEIVIDAGARLANENGILPDYDADGIHPNNAAHVWIANQIKEKIGVAVPTSPSAPAPPPAGGGPGPSEPSGELGVKTTPTRRRRRRKGPKKKSGKDKISRAIKIAQKILKRTGPVPKPDAQKLTTLKAALKELEALMKAGETGDEAPEELKHVKKLLLKAVHQIGLRTGSKQGEEETELPSSQLRMIRPRTRRQMQQWSVHPAAATDIVAEAIFDKWRKQFAGRKD